MKIITIGGVPGAGKTTLSKKMGEENNCLSLELENLRWEFFKLNLEKNVFSYTNNEKMNEKETFREYYLRNSIYDGIMDKEMFKKWNMDTMVYINEKSNNIYNELKEIEESKDIDRLKKFVLKYESLINYIPQDITLEIIDPFIISFLHMCNRSQL